jgi:hypothetical protein
LIQLKRYFVDFLNVSLTDNAANVDAGNEHFFKRVGPGLGHLLGIADWAHAVLLTKIRQRSWLPGLPLAAT